MLFKSLVSKLKIASATVLGGIKVGDNLTIEPDGKLNATSTDISVKADKVAISPDPAGYVATFDSTGNLAVSDRQVGTDIPPDPTAANDFIVATSGLGGIAWDKKTLAETKTILGVDDLSHNSLSGLDGGSASPEEYYHITEDEHDNVERYSPLFDNMLVGKDTEILSSNNHSLWESINNNGEAVGVDGNDGTAIYRDSYGNVTNLGYLGIPSAAGCEPTKINDSGIIVGNYDTEDYVSKGFYKLPNEDAITIPLIVSSVNNNGVAVGWDSSGNLCTYDPINGVTNLGKFGYTGVYGRGINDNGDICGLVDDSGTNKWFIRLSNDPDNLIVDAVDYGSCFNKINNDGDAVGYCTVSGGWTPLLRKSDGTIVKIDIPTKFVGDSGCQFYDINNNGDAVGYFTNSAWDSSIGFIRLSDGTIIYLDQLNNVVIPYSINDSREIVGYTTNSDWSEEYALYIPPLTNFIPDASTTKRGLVKVGTGLSIGEYNTLTVDTSAVDHNSLNGLQGGDSTSSEYYHLDSAEYAIVQNTSGTNTGDQESSDFTHNNLSGIAGSSDGYHISSTVNTALTDAQAQLDNLQTDKTPTFAGVTLGDAAKITWGIAPASDHTCTGNIANMTAGEALTYGQCCYLKSDGKWYKADSDSSSTMPAMAIVADAAGISSAANGNFLIGWTQVIRDDSWSWTIGAPMYVSGTAGSFTQTVPSTTYSQVQIVGFALTATTIALFPVPILVEVGLDIEAKNTGYAITWAELTSQVKTFTTDAATDQAYSLSSVPTSADVGKQFRISNVNAAPGKLTLTLPTGVTCDNLSTAGGTVYWTGGNVTFELMTATVMQIVSANAVVSYT